MSTEHVVTTEVLGQYPQHVGRITIRHHEPLSTSEHLTHVDIKVEGTCFMDYETGRSKGHISLDRVDADKLIHVLQQLQREAGRPVT